jgi:hypothetical protein
MRAGLHTRRRANDQLRRAEFIDASTTASSSPAAIAMSP